MTGITHMGGKLEDYVESILPRAVKAKKLGLKKVCDVIWNGMFIECKNGARNQIRPWKGCIEVTRNETGMYVIPADYNLYKGSHYKGQHAVIGLECHNGEKIEGPKFQEFRVLPDELEERLIQEWNRCANDAVYQRKLAEARQIMVKIAELQHAFNNDSEYQDNIDAFRLLGPTWNPDTEFPRPDTARSSVFDWV